MQTLALPILVTDRDSFGYTRRCLYSRLHRAVYVSSMYITVSFSALRGNRELCYNIRFRLDWNAVGADRELCTNSLFTLSPVMRLSYSPYPLLRQKVYEMLNS